MKMRPHHALCVQKFTGHGYDEDFTRHMTRIVSRLRGEPDTQVNITFGCDDLCAHCPNCVSNACVTFDKVDIMDKAAASLCGVSPGDELTWSELSKRAQGIFGTDGFQRVCGGCEWYELCKNTTI